MDGGQQRNPVHNRGFHDIRYRQGIVPGGDRFVEDQELGRRKARAEEADRQEFEVRHRRLSDRVERMLMQLVILGLVAVVVMQALLTNGTLRQKLNLLEGTDGYALTTNSTWWQSLTGGAPGAGAPQAVAAATPTAKSFTLTVQLETMRSAPEAKLLVGGKAVATFQDGQATVSVQPGQLVAVDGSRYDSALIFRVVAAPGLESPPLSSEVTTRGDRQSLGVVRRRAQ